MNGSTVNDHNDFIMSRQKIDVSVHEEPRHRPLTPFRFLRGILCLIVLLSTALMMMIYFGPFTAVVLRLFSIHYSRKVMSSLFGCWLALWPFLFEKINGTKVVFAGDKVPPGERVLIIANHRTEVDWMYLWDLALRKGRLGYIKYVLKNSLMKLPIFGWGFHILEFISVARRWDVDESGMSQILSTFSDPQDPLWLAVFPEGTDFSDEKCLQSQKFASENGLPVLKNVLLPKIKGFNVCMEYLRNSINAVYDVTIGYKYRCPSLMDNVFGVDPSEVHIHITRIPLSSIPISEDNVSAWLMERFEIKDQLLSNFTTKGCFPQNDVEGDLSTTRCLVYTTGILSFTVISMYLTFFSSFWFKIYVVLSAAYLASATYFNIRPSPLLGRIFNRIKND